MLTLAVGQHAIQSFRDWDQFATSMEHEVATAAGQGADILVFGEHLGCLLARTFSLDVYTDLYAQLEALQTLQNDFIDIFAYLARTYQVNLIAPSIPWQEEAGTSYHARTWVFNHQGAGAYQDKQVLTRAENEHWGMRAAKVQQVFALAGGRIGILPGYAAEFPQYARALCEQGANLLLVPSWTQTHAGYWRLRYACQARAVEQQCYVAQATVIGESDWSPMLDQGMGSAGVFTPCDYGFPAEGVLALGDGQRSGWVYAKVDLGRIDHIRAHGQVLNFRDWGRYQGMSTQKAALHTGFF
ncbi:Predicted amidohydrolase [Allopseudospirillum japonicum]|uniref:Predicted amidohydrolase n=1 Tax=Allopseudospirillum japonicum TaxID=64971 RepID=A0A1H6SCI5_9GAMM|nr:nitrilase-related carbon-nitrogen hydrolase [Allopseudospirillum japonicum]SEI65579.1 Predicted amidohydrolase [Allopseudospirillum japonicum]